MSFGYGIVSPEAIDKYIDVEMVELRKNVAWIFALTCSGEYLVSKSTSFTIGCEIPGG